MNTLQELYEHLLNIQVSGISVKHMAICIQTCENLLREEAVKNEQDNRTTP